MDDVRQLGGVLLMVGGMLLLGYVTVVDLSHSRTARWRDRPLVLAPLAIVLLVVGGLLLAR